MRARRGGSKVVRAGGAQRCIRETAERLSICIRAKVRSVVPECNNFRKGVDALRVRQQRLEVVHVQVARRGRRVGECGVQTAHIASTVQQLVIVDMEQVCEACRPRPRQHRVDVLILPVHLEKVVTHAAAVLCFDARVPRRRAEQHRELRRILDAQIETIDAAHQTVVTEPRRERRRPLGHAYDGNARRWRRCCVLR